ncbi:MAG: thioesterase family protein [Flavobacteriaceae bacterium]|nr:thioesterase family protein [Flavobacteriaceae bacterium]
MKSHQTKVKVRYGETDQMGVVYHGNYAQYFEIGRIEWLSSLGVSYKEMEAQGIMLPVVVLNINYSKPAFYEDVLLIKTTLLKLPKVSIEFEYELKNQQGELLTTAYTKLVFVDTKTQLPMRCPDFFLDKMQN